MKQVIVVNQSLKLPRGKLAAQVAHGSLASFISADTKTQQQWLDMGMPKVVLAAANEVEILAIFNSAHNDKLPVQLIKDAGRTVVKAGTITCVGIGPATEEQINKITGSLKLL